MPEEVSGHMHAKNINGMSRPIPQQILCGVFKRNQRRFSKKSEIFEGIFEGSL